MKSAKNIASGFLVSFLGSVPLGYLNVVGYQVLDKNGVESLHWYLMGVISIEIAVVWLMVIFAEKLSANKKLLKAIEMFSIFFLLALAVIFWYQSQQKTQSDDYLSAYAGYSSFIIGISLSALNFIQLPFWIGWNLYLINAGFLFPDGARKLFYIFATAVGTYSGMLAFIYFINMVTIESGGFSGYIANVFIPLFFLAFALLQAWRVYSKYYSKAKKSHF